MRRLTLPLYVGGFLGPFAGAMLAVLLAGAFSAAVAVLLLPWFARYR